jgi:hypothetical protein
MDAVEATLVSTQRLGWQPTVPLPDDAEDIGDSGDLRDLGDLGGPREPRDRRCTCGRDPRLGVVRRIPADVATAEGRRRLRWGGPGRLIRVGG